MPNLSKFPIIYLLFIVLTFLIGIFLFPGFHRERKLNLNDLERSAQQAYLSGDFIAAENNFTEALKIDDDNPSLLAGVIGSIAAEGSRSGNEGEAQKKAEKYIKKASKSDDRDVYNSLGYLAEINGRYEEALNNYDKAIAKDSSFALGWFHRAHTLEFMGKKEEAAVAYEEAFQMSSSDPLILLAQGRNKALSRKFDEANEIFLELTGPGVPDRIRVEALTNLSALKRSQGYIEEALEFSKRAVEVDRKFGPALANHGFNLAIIAGNFDEGVYYLKESMRANTRSAQPYWWIGQVFRIAKRFDEAIYNQKKGLAMLENDNTLVGPHAIKSARIIMTYDLARTYAMAGKNNEALDSLEEIPRLGGDVKGMLKKDSKHSFFKSLVKDVRFQALQR